MDYGNQITDRDELLEKLVTNSSKQLFYTRVTSLAALVLCAAVTVCLSVVVPKVMTTVESANEILTQVSETITLADTTLESVTSMSTSISDMGTTMDTFITDNAETVEEIMTKLEEIDFEGLNDAIEDLGDVVEPLANFFGKFS